MSGAWRSRWLPLALASVAVALALLLIPRHSLPTAMESSIRWFAAAATAFVWLALAAAGMRWNQPRHAMRWLAAAFTLFAAGAAISVLAARVYQGCTAPYAGSTVVIGTEPTKLARAHIAAGNSAAPQDLVADAAGRVEAIWTAESISGCRMRLFLAGCLWFPLLAGSFAGLLQASRSWRSGVLLPKATPPGPAAMAQPPEIRYDAFLSYRHGGADAEFARQLLMRLEEAGWRVALDERDFRPEQHYVLEMERCVRESRYTLAIISRRYLESGNTEEEALIGKVLDLDQRRRRLIPLFIEPVELPIWLRGTVGIDFARTDSVIDPFERLTRALAPPAQ